MRIVVTGAAGFIGSTTSQHLLDAGHSVLGIDSLSNFYDVEAKCNNLQPLVTSERFSFHKLDLTTDLFDSVLHGADAIIHLAGQPGVRRSWGEFDTYVEANVAGTKAVLDAAIRHDVDKLIYASSSSIYGNASTYPTTEHHAPSPQSPYAMTKLAGEQLCSMYAAERRLPTISLRYFTVYGPRQRPDMLTHRLIEAAHTGSSVTIFGDGRQVRDFTYVDDIARANVSAVTADAKPGSIYNIAGGTSASVATMIKTVERTSGSPIRLAHQGEATGDVQMTGGDCTLAENELGWTPTVSLHEGISRHVDFYRSTCPVETKAAIA